MELNKTKAVKLSGLVDSHADAISRIAVSSNAFLLFRPVNPNSTSLIKEGFGTKGLDIHSKSSDWGPHAGFICENQLLSKADTQGGVDKGNQDSAHSLHDSGTKVARFPLLLTEGRIDELADNKRGTQLIRVDGTWPGSPVKKVFVYPTKALGSKGGAVELGLVDYSDRAFFMQTLDGAIRNESQMAFASMVSKIKAAGKRYIVVYRMPGGSFSPVFALGYKSAGLPVTADYDVFAMCPHLSSARPEMLRQLSQTSNRKSGRLYAAVTAVMSSLGQKERRNVDPQMGRITAFQQATKNLINQACNGMDNPVVHHGTEMDNTQFPEQDGRITIFAPSGAIAVTNNWTEVQNAGQDILRLGYVFYRNRSYVANPQNQDMSQGKKYYFGQGEVNKSELNNNGKQFVWNPESGAALKVLGGLGCAM